MKASVLYGYDIGAVGALLTTKGISFCDQASALFQKMRLQKTNTPTVPCNALNTCIQYTR